MSNFIKNMKKNEMHQLEKNNVSNNKLHNRLYKVL